MGVAAEFHLLPRLLLWLNLFLELLILLPQSECWHHPAILGITQNDFKAGKKKDKETDRVAKALSPCGKQ